MVVAAAAADVAVEPAACEEAPLLVVPDPLLVGEPPLLDEVGEGDCEVVVVGLCDDEVGVGEEDVVVGASEVATLVLVGEVERGTDEEEEALPELGVDDTVAGGDVVAVLPDDDDMTVVKKERKRKKEKKTL